MQGSTGAAGVSSPQGVYFVGKHLIVHGANVKFANLGYAAMQNADLTSADFSYASCECVDVGRNAGRSHLDAVAPQGGSACPDQLESPHPYALDVNTHTSSDHIYGDACGESRPTDAYRVLFAS